MSTIILMNAWSLKLAIILSSSEMHLQDWTKSINVDSIKRFATNFLAVTGEKLNINGLLEINSRV